MRFSIEREFDGKVTEKQREAFDLAVGRWKRIIRTGDPLMIRVRSGKLDRKEGLLAKTTIVAPRKGAQGGENFRREATITLDIEDMELLDTAQKEAADDADAGRIARFRGDLIAHEIGHALGFSREVWEAHNLLDGSTFIGRRATREYGKRLAAHVGSREAQPTPVPLEIFGGAEQFIGHWRQAIFHSELMTFIVEDRPNPIGPVTMAALADLGYEVVDPPGAEIDHIDFTDQIDFTGTLAPDVPVPRRAKPEKPNKATHTLFPNRRWCTGTAL